MCLQAVSGGSHKGLGRLQMASKSCPVLLMCKPSPHDCQLPRWLMRRGWFKTLQPMVSRQTCCVFQHTLVLLHIHTGPCLFACRHSESACRHSESGRPQRPAVLPVLRQCAATSPSPLAGLPPAAGCLGGSCGMQRGPKGGSGTSSCTGQLGRGLVSEWGPSCHAACGTVL
jgi:hypothetical protein